MSPDALPEYFRYCFCDSREYAETPPNVTLTTGALFWNLKVHPLLPLSRKVGFSGFLYE